MKTAQEPSLAVGAILETVLYVDDLSKAEDFYRSVLQLTTVHSDDRMRVLRVSETNYLLLFRSTGISEPIDVPGGWIPKHGGRGHMHVAFSIRKDEIDAWIAHMETQGVPIESTVNWPTGETSLYFRDPSGSLVELATEHLWRK